MGNEVESSARAAALAEARRTRTATGWCVVNCQGTAQAQIAMYVSTDKNPKMVRGEVQAKRLHRPLAERYSDHSGSWKNEVHRNKSSFKRWFCPVRGSRAAAAQAVAGTEPKGDPAGSECWAAVQEEQEQ